jgi:hypothetical protein
MTDNQLTYIGYQTENTLVGIRRQDRRRHLYIIGKTGVGKSTLLKNLIIQDLRNGEGVAVIDPHGDLAEELLNYIPRNRIRHTLYFNPADLYHPIGFNILNQSNRDHYALVASNCVSIFKHLWSESWGPRLEYILHNSILTLLEIPNTTLLSLPRLLIEPSYRNQIIQRIKNPIVKKFWLEEYDTWTPAYRNEAIAPVQNKVGAFLTDPLLRNILSQPKSKFDLGWMMDNRRIFLANLSKGKVGEDASNLLGSLIITQFHLAAMQRVNQPEDERQDFHLYIDEFQNFNTDSFTAILSEARKYRLTLTIAHQYIDQLTPQLQASIFGNIGSLITFRIGSRDAEVLHKEFYPYYDQEKLQTIDRHQIYYKLSVNGITSQPDFCYTLPSLQPVHNENRKPTIIEQSRRHYARGRAEIETKIQKWLSNAKSP